MRKFSDVLGKPITREEILWVALVKTGVMSITAEEAYKQAYNQYTWDRFLLHWVRGEL